MMHPHPQKEAVRLPDERFLVNVQGPRLSGISTFNPLCWCMERIHMELDGMDRQTVPPHTTFCYVFLFFRFHVHLPERMSSLNILKWREVDLSATRDVGFPQALFRLFALQSCDQEIVAGSTSFNGQRCTAIKLQPLRVDRSQSGEKSILMCAQNLVCLPPFLFLLYTNSW